MKSKVALIDTKEHGNNSLAEALKLIGGIAKLNTSKRDIILKVGVYSAGSNHHTTVGVTSQIVEAFNKANKIYLTESDSYKGTGSERLMIWKKLFSDRVIPYNISDDDNTQPVRINTEIMDLSIELPLKLFKPNVLVSTHVLRTMSKGSILKNIFGLLPTARKAKFHKNEIFNTMLPDVTEAIGGIDLAVLDGTYLHYDPNSAVRVKTNLLVVGTDAVAVETVGYMLVGMKPERLATIQSFANRGLGVAELNDIEILGASYNSMKERIDQALAEAKMMASERPKQWSPAQATDKLIRSGFFRLPNKRTIDDVIKKMVAEDSRAEGRNSMITSNLRRRMKRGMLIGEKGPDGWLFWSE